MARLRHMSTALLDLSHHVAVRTPPMHTCLRTLIALTPLLLTQCAGDVAAPAGPGGAGGLDGPNGEPGPSGAGALCTQAVQAPLTVTPLRRLTKEQYRNSLRALLTSSLPGQGEAVFREIEPVLSELPPDTRDKQKVFSTMDSAVTQQHAKVYLRIGEKVAEAITSNSSRMSAFMGCRAGEAAKSCIDGFIQRFGTKAFRHKLTEDETALFHEAYADSNVDAAAVADVIALGLNAPQFIYQVETGGEPIANKPGHYQLTDYELANRLALHFWREPPDDKLMKLAESGQLRTNEGYESALKMVLDDKRTQASVTEFAREWLNLDALPALDVTLAKPEFASFLDGEQPTRELRTAMIDDVVESFRFHLDRGDKFRDWFLSPYSFAKHDGLARVYQTPKWSGSGTPPTFPNNTRGGLITRAAFLTSGYAETRPIKKGVLLRERILCHDLPPPPEADNVNASSLAAATAHPTTRDAVEELTHRTPCSNCHTKLINPLGFATEGFDALGRARTHQTQFDKAGQPMGKHPVDTMTTPYIDGEQDSRVIHSATELAKNMADSKRVEACFARQYVRYTFGRREAAQGTDECMIGTLESVLEKGLSMRDTIKALATRPEFRTKFLDPTQQ